MAAQHANDPEKPVAIEVTRCESCGTVFSYRRPYCTSCYNPTETVSVFPRGVVYSATTVHMPTAGFEAEAPYQVVLVDCDDGNRMLALADPPLAIGARVFVAIRSRLMAGDVPVAKEAV